MKLTPVGTWIGKLAQQRPGLVGGQLDHRAPARRLAALVQGRLAGGAQRSAPSRPGKPPTT